MLLFFSAYATVFLLVFQQQNVIHRQFIWAGVTSVLITISQFVVVKGIASGGLSEMLLMSIGGVLGVLSSMLLHERLLNWYRE
jgi:hypothetical protein